MTSKTLKSAVWMTLAAGALTLAAGGAAYGKGPPEGKGNKPDSEAGFNLSVPAIIAGGSSGFPITCETEFTDLVPPSKDPVFYPESCADTHDGTACVDAGNYYVQRDATWQAPCMEVTAGSVSASGAWGDNLEGDAKLKVGSPIRVELVLWDSANVADETKLGYEVIKLEPYELDRVSDYGHLAGGTDGAWEDMPKDLGAIVHDTDATLTIEKIVGGAVASTVYTGDAGAEINATGKIVYGHNLRVVEAGLYRITYSLPNVQLTGCDLGDCSSDATKAVLEIEVIPGGGSRPIK